jgi:hypothetical protein
MGHNKKGRQGAPLFIELALSHLHNPQGLIVVIRRTKEIHPSRQPLPNPVAGFNRLLSWLILMLLKRRLPSHETQMARSRMLLDLTDKI